MTPKRATFASLMTLMLIVAPAAGAPLDLKDPPQGRFIDEWAEVYLAGGKVGYAHSTMARDGDLILTATNFLLRIGRGPQTIEMRTEQQTQETVDGKPIRFASEMDASMMKSTMRGTIEEGRVSIVNSQFGMEQKQEFPFPKGALMTWGLAREAIIQGFKPGVTYASKVYAPEMRLDDALDAKTVVGEWEEFVHAGKKRRGQRVTTTLTSPIGSVESTAWVDATGRPMKVTLPAPGLGDMTLVTTDQESALADFVTPEIFMATTIKANKPIDRDTAKRITYRLRPTAKEVDLASMPETDAQQVTEKPDGVVEIVVSRQVHEPAKTGSGGAGRPESSGGEDMTEYLLPNLMINTEDPELIALAKRAAGQETEPFTLAERLTRFVTQYVDDKNLSVGFATASEVCRTKEGDCSEHGILLAALGRINGLPSRVAVGLAYVPFFGGQKRLFGYHLWTQFFIDGRWVDFDAALHEPVCSPTRIAFATSSLQNTGLADLSLPLLTKIGGIDLEILSIETLP